MKNFFLFLLFAGGLSAWYLYYQQGKAAAELTELSKNLALYEQSVQQRRVEFQALTKAVELQKKIQLKQGEIATVQERERGLKEVLAGLVKKRAAVILSARQAYVGRVLPELTLTNGKKLAQVKILKADDSGLSVSLPSGIQKILPSELPPEMCQNLHY